MYSETGPPSIEPVILVKLTFIQYTFGIRSMRKTLEGADYLRHHQDAKSIYAKHKVSIEPEYADAKEKRGSEFFNSEPLLSTRHVVMTACLFGLHPSINEWGRKSAEPKISIQKYK
ncbi:transposase [Peribacillus frigoritolerans]